MIRIRLGSKQPYSNNYQQLAIPDYYKTNQLLENKDNFLEIKIEEKSNQNTFNDALNQNLAYITQEILEKNQNTIEQTNLNIINSIKQTEIRLVGENNIGIVKTLNNKRAYIFPQSQNNTNYHSQKGGRADTFYNTKFKSNILSNIKSSNSKSYSHQSPLKYQEFRPKSRSKSRSKSKPRTKDKRFKHSSRNKQNASKSKSPSSKKLHHKSYNKSRSHSRQSHKEKIKSRSNSSGNTKNNGHYIKSQHYNKSDQQVRFTYTMYIII